MKNALLALYPADPFWRPPDIPALAQLLQSIQLIDGPCCGDGGFLAGERFLDLIAFMGCSPDIKLNPEENSREFCFIRLQSNPASIEFHSGEHPNTPRCGRCNTPVDDWKRKIGARLEIEDNERWECTACQHAAAPWSYNWRKTAGFGRCFININNVYPREAVPQQPLLDTLHSHYGVDWQYFYQY